MESWRHLSSLLSKTTQQNQRNNNFTNQQYSYTTSETRNETVGVYRVMAKPIPDLKSLSRLDKTLPGDAPVFRDSVDKYLAKSCNNNLILGTVTGWVSGVGVVRAGKLAALGLGGGVLLLHAALELGYVEVRWERLREAAAHSHHLLNKLLKLLRDNGCFSMGFIGGFFFGIAAA